MSTMTIESSRFGTLEIAADDVIEFPAGLIGLGGRRYALVADRRAAPFAWLHSIDDPSLALPVTNPWRFFTDYEVELVRRRRPSASASDAAEVAVWVTVRAGAELADFSANLRAPILVVDGHGHQVINEAANAPVRAPLFPDVRPSAGRLGRTRSGAVPTAFQGGSTMLIITRRPGEKIMLGDDIVVHVMEIVGNSVRVGIAGPALDPGLPRGDLGRRARGEPRRRAGSPDSCPRPPRRPPSGTPSAQDHFTEAPARGSRAHHQATFAEAPATRGRGLRPQTSRYRPG